MNLSGNNGVTPRRCLAEDTQVEPIDNPAPTRARRGRAGLRLDKRAIAAGMAGLLAAGTLFTYAVTGRAGQGAGFGLDASAAVPDAAQAAAESGFGYRPQDHPSRNTIRDNISDAAVDVTAQQRLSQLDQAASQALELEAEGSSEERSRQMEADLKLVAAQAEELKKQAEEASELLRLASQSAKKNGSSGKITAEQIEVLSTKGASMPLKENFAIGARYGQLGIWARYHTGQDFRASTGTPVYAVAPGVVLSPTKASWAGNNIVIQHAEGATLYAHLSRSLVSPNEVVKPGQLIGYVGATGRVTGAHLHFEFYKNGTTPGDVYSASDPMVFLRQIGATK